MDDEAAKCRGCGAELTGRDVYEGVCKACREEAVLGSPAPQPKRTRGPAPPPASATPRPLPDDAIAIEASVDLDADTREIPADDEPSEPPEASPAPPEGPAPAELALDEEPEAALLPPREATPTRPPEEAPAADDLPVLKLDDAPPSSEATGRLPLALETAPPQAHRPPPTVKRNPPSRDPLEDAHAQEPPPPRLRITPRAPQPTPAAPAPAPREPHKPLALATDAPREEPPAPAEPAPEPDFELPALEPDPRDRQGPPRIAPPEPEAAAPAPPPSRDREGLRLKADTAAGNLRGLLDEMQSQVEQLSKVLSTAHRVAPSAFWSGFRAAFGFVLGLAVLAVVSLGLMALIGKLFYPRAFEFVLQLLRIIGLL